MSQRLAQQRVVEQVDLPHRQVVGRPPPRVQSRAARPGSCPCLLRVVGHDHRRAARAITSSSRESHHQGPHAGPRGGHVRVAASPDGSPGSTATPRNASRRGRLGARAGRALADAARERQGVQPAEARPPSPRRPRPAGGRARPAPARRGRRRRAAAASTSRMSRGPRQREQAAVRRSAPAPPPPAGTPWRSTRCSGTSGSTDAGAGRHHQPLERAEAHRGVHRAAVAHRRRPTRRRRGGTPPGAGRRRSRPASPSARPDAHCTDRPWKP